jgi:hypothetical protein
MPAAVPLMLNPSLFSALSFIAGPALLTNASSLLLLGTTNRYGLALERSQRLAGRIMEIEDDHRSVDPLLLKQLDLGQQRVLLIARSLTFFYIAVCCLGLGTLSFLLGITLAEVIGPTVTKVSTLAILVVTVAGVICLIVGAATLTWESRLSYRILRYDADAVRSRAAQHQQGRKPVDSTDIR